MMNEISANEMLATKHDLVVAGNRIKMTITAANGLAPSSLEEGPPTGVGVV
jgi:hypothetical protein